MQQYSAVTSHETQACHHDSDSTANKQRRLLERFPQLAVLRTLYVDSIRLFAVHLFALRMCNLYEM